MKKIFACAALFYTVLSFAQFNIQGEIKGYANQPIFIKIYENGAQRLIQRVTTNEYGSFKYQFPMEYIGILSFELSKGGFEMVSDNQNITFSTDLNDKNHVFTYQHQANELVKEYQHLKDLLELKNNTLLPLSKYYNTQEKFHKDLLDEIARIDALRLPEIANNHIRYYIETKELLSVLNDSSAKPIESANTAKKHLVSDDDRLERFGFLNPFISVYISNSLGKARTRDEAEKVIQESLDILLDEVVVETPRGQNILTTIIPMLQGNGFPNLSDKYLTLAGSMNCEKTGELQNILEVEKTIKVGEKAPNFSLKGTKTNSLYDIKSKKKLIVFWASWCPHCLQEMPYIKEFYTNFKKDGGEIVAISLDMDKNKFNTAIKNYDWINYSDFLKWDGPIVKQYGVISTPTMIMLDENNKILKIGSRVSEFISL